MAQRFGGKYSPQGGGAKGSKLPPAPPSGAYTGARVSPVGAKANIMFIPAIPLVATTFFAGGVPMATGLAGACLWLLGAWLLREGLKAEAAFDARKIARRPAIPRKIFAAIATGLGTGAAVMAHAESAAAGHF